MSITSYLDFVFYFSKNEILTFDVDVLQETNLGYLKFEQMIENAKAKHKIIPGERAITDTGKPLIEICNEFGLKDLKEVLERIETK